jgi:hypothetical protein
MRRVRLAALGIVLVLSALLPAAPAALAQSGEPSLTTIASGLNNARGLNIGPDGTVYVAEAGTPEANSGSITAVTDDGFERVVTGLPSTSFMDEVVGPHDVTTYGLGRFQVTIGLGGTSDTRSPDTPLLGTAVRVSVDGGVRAQADLAAFETAEDPDGQGADSNPYGILHAPGIFNIAADAGGNSLVRYGIAGRVRTLATFPNLPATAPDGSAVEAQAVPTSVARGRDGALYVGELTGFPFPVDGARVWRVPRRGGEPEVYAEGFTNIIDIAFDRGGNLYVLEFAEAGLLNVPEGELPAGALHRVAPDGTQERILTDLPAPGGVAVGRHGEIYITTNSVVPGAGEVVQVEL